MGEYGEIHVKKLKEEKGVVPGAVVAYSSRKDPTKYGLIQVLQRSEVTYWVRIFYGLHDSLDERKVKEIVNSKAFYFIKDFFDLDCANHYLGTYLIPNFVELPKLMRCYEDKPSGKYYWYAIDVSAGNIAEERILKTFKEFDESLRPLSPSENWAINRIMGWWEDGVTLETWDTEYLRAYRIEYLREHEPHNLEAFLNPNFASAIKNKPTKLWKKSLKAGESTLTAEEIDTIDKLLDKFITAIGIEELTLCQAKKITKYTVHELNAINAKHECIETLQRDELSEYLESVLSSRNLTEAADIIDEERDW